MPGVGLGRRAWKRSKPAEVDWENPLTEGMLMCVPGDRVPFTCLVTGRRFTMDGAPLLNAPNVFGAGADTSSTAKRGGQYVIGTTDIWSLQPPHSVAFAGTDTVALVTSATSVGVLLSGSPFVCYGLNNDGTGYRASANDGGIFHAPVSTIVTPASRLMRTQVAVRYPTTLELWVNGRREGEVTGRTNSTGYNSSATMCIGSESTAGRYNPGSIALCVVWNRALGGSEIAAFNVDPMQLLKRG